MNKKITLLLLLSITLGFAQIPTGYYSSATGSGYALKTQLKKIIDNNNDGLSPEYLHSDQGYGALWTLFTQSAFRDNYYENNGSLLDMYSENPTGADSYEFTNTGQQCGSYSNEGDCYNREHLVPQSYFDHITSDPMKNDPFHAVPSDGKVNGWRNNLPFGVVSGATSPCNSGATNTPCNSSNNSKKGNNTISPFSNYNGTVFEPINEFKGDIARCYFYFATRYEDLMDDFYAGANASSCEAKNMFDGSIDKVFSDQFILLLIKWHLQDPVSAKEIAQNNAIYAFQGNRNPFIDHPNYVCDIWTTQCTTVQTLGSESFASINDISIYPNPTSNGTFSISSTVELSSITIYNINGQIVQKVRNPSTVSNETYNISNLSTGFYLVKIDSEYGSTTKKIIVN
jgi:endonuclease I